MNIRVLHLGWEFPPYSHGGLGVACEGLIKGLTNHGIEILLVLPRYQPSSIDRCHIIGTNIGPLLHIKSIDSLLQPYINSQEYAEYYKQIMHNSFTHLYGSNIFSEIERYARVVSSIICDENFDIIHAHDWMSFKAGILAKLISEKPLIVHIHATEFDRTGGNGVNQLVYNIERWGMHEADKIIAVSQFTKNKVVHHYDIDPSKVEVVHNAIDTMHYTQCHSIKNKEKPIVLFLGRLTLQKGPDYFIAAAKEILKYRPNITFVIAGSGDMEKQLISSVAQSGLSDTILFTGQLDRDEVNQAYQMADIFIMPSVSEPFGLTALEAAQRGTPVIVSKQSGVSEVIGHVLKVDFWDINEIVNKVIGILDHAELKQELIYNADQEVHKMDWDTAAKKCISIYQQYV